MSFYAISKGRKVGIFDSWVECKTHTFMYPGAIYKKFDTKEEADAFIFENDIENNIEILTSKTVEGTLKSDSKNAFNVLMKTNTETSLPLKRLIDYYDRQKDDWDDNEIQQIKKEYESDEMTIGEIGRIHRRTPGSVAYKLKALELVTSNFIARGYAEYKASDLYKEIVELGKAAEIERKIKKEAKLKAKMEKGKTAGNPLEILSELESPPESPVTQEDPCTPEQRDAINAVHAGQTIFLTGPGGTGKSFLLKVLYDEFEKSGKKMAVTAMTGCAALLLGPHAKTLHSWAGIGLGRDSAETIIQAISRNGKKKKNWKVDCLVIDEVSMMTPEILELLDKVGRSVRKNRLVPMGGLQIVFVGDFYQLPPVADKPKFAFQCTLWKQIVKKTVYLKTIHRQRDPIFQKILLEAREGELSDESYETLMSRKGLRLKGLQIRPTLLFTRNADVNTINTKELGKLLGDAVTYKVITACERDYDEQANKKGFEKSSTATPEPSDYRIQKLDKDASYVTDLQLKIGAQVMLITNLDQEAGLVNGSRGVVLGFGPNGPSVKFLSLSYPYTVKPHTWKSSDDEPVYRTQVPLRLAYALTIHKAQGASLDSAMVDIGPATFEYGQAYVALSRVRSLEALYVYDLDRTAFKVHPAVKEFYDTLQTDADHLEQVQEETDSPCASPQ